jgi:shikimate 5-dehydrogenase
MRPGTSEIRDVMQIKFNRPFARDDGIVPGAGGSAYAIVYARMAEDY